jgi:hypothetical protein
MTDLPTEIETWTSANGFSPADEEIGGATPLLRSGVLGTTDVVYRGRIEDREVLLAEFSIGSPDWSDQFGGSGTDSSVFTVMLTAVTEGRWPRLIVHPKRLSDHHWIRRLVRADREVDDVPESLREEYRVIAATSIPEERLRGLFTDELAGWWLAQPTEVIVDVEDHEGHGGYMTVAHPGIASDSSELDDLLAQTSHLAQLIDP